MRNPSDMRALPRPVLRLGKKARSALRAGWRGKILASTSRAIYLVTGSQDLLWLAPGRSALHRRCVQVGQPLPRVRPGTECAVVGRRLELGMRIAFDLSSAPLWDLPPAILGDVGRMAPRANHLVATIPSLARRHRPAGFGVLLPAIMEHIDIRPFTLPMMEPTAAAQRAWPAVREVLDGCMANDLQRAFTRAEELIGLGEGLTPSGDDFVGGLVHTLSRLRPPNLGLGRVQPRDLAELLRKSETHTNVISHTLLVDHASGHASDALQRLVDALLTGDLESIEGRAARLIEVGQSSGWDLFTGVVVAILATCDIVAPGWRAEARPARL